MPKKSANKRTFREWFFGIEQTKTKPNKKKTITKKKQKTSSTKQHNRKPATKKQTESDDIQRYISDAVDRLPGELAATQKGHDAGAMSQELARKQEAIKRKHLRIGVVAFATLVGALWMWNMVISITQLAVASSESFEGAKDRAVELNEQVSQTLDEKIK